jgi:hypothetical protein
MPGKFILLFLLFACENASEKETTDTQEVQDSGTDTGASGQDSGADSADTAEGTDPMNSAEIVAADLGLSGLNLHLDPSEIEAQQAYGGLSFIDAFEKALLSILNDGTDEESPLTIAGDQGLLISLLNQDSSDLWLIPDRERQPDDDWYPPEYGESLSENWLFQLLIPSLSDHLFWTIVPRDGGNPWNYGFN